MFGSDPLYMTMTEESGSPPFENPPKLNQSSAKSHIG